MSDDRLSHICAVRFVYLAVANICVCTLHMYKRIFAAAFVVGPFALIIV